MTGAGSVLAIPEGWILDPLSNQHLQRGLSLAGSACTAVVADRRELPPGSSYVVSAERRARTAESDARPFEGLSVRGAAMVRQGVGFEVGADFVVVERGVLLTDPGAVVHDPWRPLCVLENASTLGRPVQRRPVALFLGFERDPYLADWVRGLVNGLVRRAVEGRIAVPEPTAGLHLTTPCAPTEESVRALSPEVVVALDDEAVELSTQWLGRGAFGIVRLTPDTTDATTIEDVRIGRSRRRLEATIGRGVSPDALAELVCRLDRQDENMA